MSELGIEGLMQQARWDEAEFACKSALQVRPTSAKLHAYLGLCLFRKNEFAMAAVSFKRATSLDEQFVDAGIKLAQCLDRMQRYEEAYEIASEWLRVRPSDRTLQGLISGLQRHVKGNRSDAWEKTAHLAHRVILAQDDDEEN